MLRRGGVNKLLKQSEGIDADVSHFSRLFFGEVMSNFRLEKKRTLEAHKKCNIENLEV